jgi:hypothetical protein
MECRRVGVAHLCAFFAQRWGFQKLNTQPKGFNSRISLKVIAASVKPVRASQIVQAFDPLANIFFFAMSHFPGSTVHTGNR